MIERLLDLLDRIKDGDGAALKLAARLVHSPFVALVVKASPNRYDDMVLELLKQLVPPPA